MIKVLTPSEMARADEATISAGVRACELMERAGAAVAREAIALMGGGYGRKVTIVCGKGNNGGDGLVAARHLTKRGASCTIFLVESLDRKGLERSIGSSDLVIDAILGTGFRGPLSPPAADAVSSMNAGRCPVLAIDIPSGVNGATGQAEGPAVQAHVTVTLGALKPGLLLHPGAGFAGRVKVADIGIPDENLHSNLHLVEYEDVRSRLPARPLWAHKRSVGKVLIVAGSAGFPGAAVLSANGALRGGAGMVWVGCPRSIAAGVDRSVPEAIVIPLPETGDGNLEASAVDETLEAAAQADCVALGPGIGRDSQTVEFASKLLPQLEKPLVIDADGINACAAAPEGLRNRSHPTVMTPHSGELSGLMGRPANEVEADRVGAARRGAESTGAIVLLKGFRTIVSKPSGDAVMIDKGGPVLSTAGSGDVLTGLITALGASTDLFDAAWTGAWVHGSAGDNLAEAMGARGVIARDIAEALPRAFPQAR